MYIHVFIFMYLFRCFDCSFCFILVFYFTYFPVYLFIYLFLYNIYIYTQFLCLQLPPTNVHVVTLPSMLPARGCASSRSPPQGLRGFAARGWGHWCSRYPVGTQYAIYLSIYIYIYIWGYPKWIVYNGKSI